MKSKAGLILAVTLNLSLSARGEPFQDLSPPAPLRGELPFSTLPGQFQGPPRAMGELPFGDTQAPSTLPGRVSGPPRASGEAPDLIYPPGSSSPFPMRSFSTGVDPGQFIPSVPPLPRSTDSRFFSSPFAADVLSPRPDGGGVGGGRPLDPGRVESPDLREPAGPGRGQALTLDDALVSAFRSYPPYLESLLAFDVARGELLAAMGGFDLNLNSDARNWTLGYYQRYLYDVFFEQPTTLWGTKFFAGYRLGVGNWPSYYRYLETRTGGAYVAGLETPLLKNGRIDARRAKLWQSQIELNKVQPLVMKQRIELVRLVSRAYVTWWAAGRAMRLAEQLTRVAIERDRGLARQVQLGGLAPIDRADSQRVVFSRQGQLVYARRRLEKSGIDLSLFLRDARAFPYIPGQELLPDDLALPPAPREEHLAEDTEVALRLRPEIWSIRFQGQKAEIQRQYAVNQHLPSLNFYLYSEQNAGGEAGSENFSANGPFILETSLLLDVPLQRRVAKGQIAVADANLRQIRFQERFAQDKIVAEVRDDFQAVRAAAQQMEFYRQSADVNRALEAAERRKFELGNSTVLALALREQATFDAELYEIEATAEYIRAVADYRAALAIDAMNPGQPGLLPPPTPPLTQVRSLRRGQPADTSQPPAEPTPDAKPEPPAQPAP
ncbi:MAG: TolC family protein [Isosphaeraceae bacterium]